LDSGFLDDLRGNSLDRVELIMAVEEVFGDYISAEDERKLRSCKTVQEAIDYIHNRKKGGDLN
jgi:acyl carrier protein